MNAVSLGFYMASSTITPIVSIGPARAEPAPEREDSQTSPTPEFLAELAESSTRLETAAPYEIITWAADRFGQGLTMATAFGPEGCLILSILAKVAPKTYVFNLDTGYQFQATLDLRDRIAERYGIEVAMLQPELSVPEY